MTAAGDGFRVDPGRLDEVTDRLTGVAAAAERARPTADQVSGDSFGLVGGVFAGAATSAMRTGDGAVTELCRCLQAMSGTLRAAVRDYEHTDLDAARAFLAVEIPVEMPVEMPRATPPSGPDTGR